jgi:hypothetical protein
MGTAEEASIFFHAMPNNFNTAIRAARRKGMNGTLKAIKCMSSTLDDNLESFIVVVTTNFTACHITFSLSAKRGVDCSQIVKSARNPAPLK